MPRKLAYDILVKYQNEQSYLNITLNDYLKNSELSRKDKDLATNIVYGTVQNKLYLEYILQPHIENKKLSGRLKMLLLMSIYQLYFLDKVPDFAIVNEAVNLTKQRDQGASNFINAILRKIINAPKPSLDDLDPITKLSIETSHPKWMVAMFCKQYDYETTVKICQSNNGTPPRIGRVNTLKTTKESILEDSRFKATQLSNVGVSYQTGNIASNSFYQNGLLTIQDESSQLVAPFLDPQLGDLVLDMTCAPGSKTTHIAALMKNSGAIHGFDLFEHKIKLVEQNLKRLGVTNVHLKAYDATKLDELYEPNTFDRILLDAPCSGLGVLKRKPEIRYHDSSAMDTIIPLQAKLLEKAYYLLKNNGKMVYSTCTINKKENENMIQSFIKKYPDMKIIDEKKIMPYEYDSDGFYMCKLEKGR